MDFGNFDLRDFRVVVSGIRAVTNAEVRICPTKIDFNAIAAVEMGYPAFVRIYISSDASKMIVIACNKGEKHAIPFYMEQLSKKTGAVLKNAPIHIRDVGLARGIRQKMKWTTGTYRCSALRFDEKPDTLFFDLSTADNSKRKRSKVGNVLDSYPPIDVLMEDMQPIALLPAPEPIILTDPLAVGKSKINKEVIEVAYCERD